MEDLNKFLFTLIEGESVKFHMTGSKLSYVSSYFDNKPYRSLVIKY